MFLLKTIELETQCIQQEIRNRPSRKYYKYLDSLTSVCLRHWRDAHQAVDSSSSYYRIVLSPDMPP